jgi:hypothetical protein
MIITGNRYRIFKISEIYKSIVRVININIHYFIHFQMNQQCKVCGEPAAGFHFGAFTCEGCKVSIYYYINSFITLSLLTVLVASSNKT